jgi:tellurite resistance protein
VCACVRACVSVCVVRNGGAGKVLDTLDMCVCMACSFSASVGGTRANERAQMARAVNKSPQMKRMTTMCVVTIQRQARICSSVLVDANHERPAK